LLIDGASFVVLGVSWKAGRSPHRTRDRQLESVRQSDDLAALAGLIERATEDFLDESSEGNTGDAIRRRYGELRLGWWPVVLFLPARLGFAALAQAVTAILLAGLGSETPWERAAACWPIYSGITDLLCLGTLVLLTRRERLRVGDLFGVSDWRAAARQLLWTPLALLAVAPGAVAANLITVSFYGSELPPMISIVNLPPIGVAYTLVVWPILWVVTEELVYLGFLLPRLEALTRRTWIAVSLVILFWGVQHVAIPFLPDETYLVSRVTAALAAIGLFPIAFVLFRRRLMPFIGVHYLADLATAFLATLGPRLVS